MIMEEGERFRLQWRKDQQRDGRARLTQKLFSEHEGSHTPRFRVSTCLLPMYRACILRLLCRTGLSCSVLGIWRNEVVELKPERVVSCKDVVVWRYSALLVEGLT